MRSQIEVPFFYTVVPENVTDGIYNFRCVSGGPPTETAGICVRCADIIGVIKDFT